MKAIAAFFGFVWRALDALRKVLHLIVLLVLFLGIAAALSPSIPIVPHKAALVIAPQGTLVEQLAGDPFERAIAELYGQQRAETLVRDLTDAIEAAKTDDRIASAGARSRPHGRRRRRQARGGCAERSATSAPAARRSSRIGEGYDQAQYYLAAQADEIYLDPQGLVLIDGFGYYRTFLKGVIDKLSIDVNVFRAGKFKSYTDQFSRSDMSEQEEEESLGWLNSLWSQYQAGIVKARTPGAPGSRRHRRLRQQLRRRGQRTARRSRGGRARQGAGDRAQVAARVRGPDEGAGRRRRG